MNAKNDVKNDDDGVDRVIILSEIDAASQNGTNMMKHQLTTIFYPDEQIGPYRISDRFKYPSTTPMNPVPHETSTTANPRENLANHRKRYDDVFPGEERSARELDIPIGFQMPNYSASRVVFPDDSITSANNPVNSIRDILEAVDNESVFPSPIPRGRSIRIAGTYRRYKPFETLETLATMPSTISVHKVPLTNSKKKPPKDPFSKFKPKSVSEVNLLAMNQVRFAPYTHHKPRPLLRSPIVDTKQKPYDYANQNTAELMYDQILWANKNRLKTTAEPLNSRGEHAPQKQKPFSLMLDVYPMPGADDEMVSSTRYTPHANRPPRPIYPLPIDANSINHNLQYGNENSYYNQMKFPQLQSYHRSPYDSSPAPSYVNGPNPNYYIYRNYVPKRQQVYPSNQNRRPSAVYDTSSPSDDTPSQITVHLNLFPNKKKAQSLSTSRMRNFQALDTDHLSGIANNDDDDDVERFYIRRMEYENSADNARVSTLSSSNNYAVDELPFRPLKTPTLIPNWIHFDEDVTPTNVSIGASKAEDTSPFDSSSESTDFDATTNYENTQNANTAKPILGNHSMDIVSDRRRRLYLPESTPTDAFSMSSSAGPVSFDDVNRSTIFSTLSSNVAQTTQQPFPIAIQTTAIAEAIANDEITNRIKFPPN